jgi:hypothetical protein
MSFNIVWNFPALATLYALPWQRAAAIDAALIRFAETGVGRIEWVPPYYRLRIGTHEAVLTLDVETRTLTVLRIYRSSSRTT